MAKKTKTTDEKDKTDLVETKKEESLDKAVSTDNPAPSPSSSTENSPVAPAPVAKTDTKAAEQKPKEKEKPKLKKKFQAVANASSIPISKRHGMYICSFIMDKPIDQAISELEQVIKFKRAIAFKGEIPHRKGMMSGRYPITASKEFITILKGLKGNAIVNGLDLEKTRIKIASTNWASRPSRRGGMRAKRSHVYLIAREIPTSQSTKQIKPLPKTQGDKK
jgi:large subunit ribosomal protein L22